DAFLRRGGSRSAKPRGRCPPPADRVGGPGRAARRGPWAGPCRRAESGVQRHDKPQDAAMTLDSFGARGMLEVGDDLYRIWRLAALQDVSDLARLPYSIKVLLENVLRHENGREISADQVAALARWPADPGQAGELAFSPERVLLQDFTGVPAVVDLAALRDALADLGGDPALVNPKVPVELVIDHSVIAEVSGSAQSFAVNAALEHERNI